jgi:hypothetical protein
MRTTAVKANGHDTYIGGGANTQDGDLKLYTCNTCKRPVVWARSISTGRMYLADVFTGQSGARYYVKASAHQCVRPEDVRTRQTLEAKLAETGRMRAENDANQALTDAQRQQLNAALDSADRWVRDQLDLLP